MSEVQILESVQQFMARQHGHFIDGKLVAPELLIKVDFLIHRLNKWLLKLVLVVNTMSKMR